MAKKKLRNDSLAKLRQYSADIDPAEFLSTEWRQVMRALEQSYVETDDATSVLTNPGFYGIQTGTYSSSQDILFSDYTIVNGVGSVTGNYLFVPATDGKFFIEAAGEWVSTGSYPGSGSTTYNSNIIIKSQAGVTLASNNYQTTFYPSYMSQDIVPGPLATIANLTTTNGAYFTCSLSGANLRKLNFKITRIGD